MNTQHTLAQGRQETNATLPKGHQGLAIPQSNQHFLVKQVFDKSQPKFLGNDKGTREFEGVLGKVGRRRGRGHRRRRVRSVDTGEGDTGGDEGWAIEEAQTRHHRSDELLM